MLAPVFLGLASAYPDVLFEVVDVDEYPESAQQYNIRTVPSVLLFKNGHLTTSIVGANAKQKYVDAIEKIINSSTIPPDMSHL
jgi:thioredoxin-like negative regulator of GroEL